MGNYYFNGCQNGLFVVFLIIILKIYNFFILLDKILLN